MIAETPPNLSSPQIKWPPICPDNKEFFENFDAIYNSGVPNHACCKIKIESKLNIKAFRENLQNFHDNIICDYLEYGWPIGYHSTDLPISQPCNHNNAHAFAKHVDCFIDTEVKLGATLGPYDANPFSTQCYTSPLNTVEKSNSTDRRVIVDLSWPTDHSINSGINKNLYLGEIIDLKYPTVDSLCKIIREKGPNSLLFKRDLKRAYRQIPIDPVDSRFLGYSWRGKLYFDRVAPFGLRSAAMMCQRTTTAINHIYKNHNYSAVNYLDDFAGCEQKHIAAIAYDTLQYIFDSLGIQESISKACPPSTHMIFIGILFNTVDMTMEVDPEKLGELHYLLPKWLNKQTCKVKELQSLIGKLQFVAKCVAPGRIFISRMLNLLKGNINNNIQITLNNEFRKDVNWWITFLPLYNGVSIIPYSHWSNPDSVFSSDACITGCGAYFRGHYFHAEFPKSIQELQLHIIALELLSITVACKIWGKHLRGNKILVFCDNTTSVTVLNSGRTKDEFLLEICYITSLCEFSVKAKHIEGTYNRTADLLSRWKQTSNPLTKLKAMVNDQLIEHVIDNGIFQFSHNW